MSQLFFKREFVPAILKGKKTTTLRRWKSQRVSAGKCAFAPGVGWLKIISCEAVQIDHLKLADARADGFPSLAALRNTLAEIYPDQENDGRQWYRVLFALTATPPPRRKATERPIKTSLPSRSLRNLGKPARLRLARRIRAELDKAVQRTRSFAK